jgi:hypothetical protein
LQEKEVKYLLGEADSHTVPKANNQLMGIRANNSGSTRYLFATRSNVTKELFRQSDVEGGKKCEAMECANKATNSADNAIKKGRLGLLDTKLFTAFHKATHPMTAIKDSFCSVPKVATITIQIHFLLSATKNSSKSVNQK